MALSDSYIWTKLFGADSERELADVILAVHRFRNSPKNDVKTWETENGKTRYPREQSEVIIKTYIKFLSSKTVSEQFELKPYNPEVYDYNLIVKLSVATLEEEQTVINVLKWFYHVCTELKIAKDPQMYLDPQAYFKAREESKELRKEDVEIRDIYGETTWLEDLFSIPFSIGKGVVDVVSAVPTALMVVGAAFVALTLWNTYQGRSGGSNG